MNEASGGGMAATGGFTGMYVRKSEGIFFLVKICYSGFRFLILFFYRMGNKMVKLQWKIIFQCVIGFHFFHSLPAYLLGIYA